jgi:hypothetical protein
MSEARRSFVRFGASVPAAIAATVIAGGCGTVSSTARDPAVLSEVESSSAVMGQMGLVRVTFSNPVLEDTTVTLSATPSSLVTLPATATVLADSLTVDVPFTGAALGYGYITATVGSDVQTTQFSVVPSISLYQLGSATMEAGAITTVYAEITSENIEYELPAPLTLAFTSSDPAVATVEPMVTIPQFQSYQQVEVTAAATGSAVLTATGSGYTATGQVIVVPQASVTSVSYNFNGNDVVPGSTQYGYVDLNAITRAGGTITLTSSDPSIVTVPASLPTTGSTSVQFPITAGTNTGTATITATYGASSESSVINVTNGSSSEFQDFCGLGTPATNMELGAAGLVLVEMCTGPQQQEVASITFGTSGILSTPSTSVEVPADPEGFEEVFFPVTATANGTTTVTVVAGGQQLQQPITVKAPVFTMNQTTLTLTALNETDNLGVDSDTLLATDRTFALASTDPSVVAVSAASVVVGAGSTSTFFGIKSVATGTATITATSGSTVLSCVVTVN